MQPTMVETSPPPPPSAEFGRPVESIMRCEDFKSNFARRLSNRYTSRSPTKSHKQDNVLKLHKPDIPENPSERIELGPQLSKSIVEQHGEDSVKCAPASTPDRQSPMSRRERSDTRVHALNMEVETLRWQLSQTEANRQMHIALLKQVVSFLNRVKEHIEYRKDEESPRRGRDTTERGGAEGRAGGVVAVGGGRASPKPADLPRSRSVLHVNRHLEYSMSPAKRHTTRKISKSISNVDGCKDTAIWNHSKLIIDTETDTEKKITEEMTRLITLANTVLGTKLPDLACTCTDITSFNSLRDNTITDEHVNTLIMNNIADTDDTYNNNKHDFNVNKNDIVNEFILRTPVPDTMENNFYDIKTIDDKTSSNTIDISPKAMKGAQKRNEYHSNFIEDESGFSSMSSFQEIGIPIISIIPASPCKEVELEYLDEDRPLSEETDSHHSLHLEKSVQVFWV